MKYRITTVAAVVAALSLPVSAHANEPAASSQPAQQKPMENMNCPMMGNMNSMQKNMGNMMGDMNSMMQMMSDPAMKERMQKMHENMGAMMQQMMGMQKSAVEGEKIKANDAPAAVAPEDHEAHHPEKQ